MSHPSRHLRRTFNACRIITSQITFVVAVYIGGLCCAGEPSGGRLSLFNGQNLRGWHVTGCQAAAEDGSLILKDGNGFVRVDHQYRDFVLEVSWRPRRTDFWDSGIYFRCALPEGNDWPEQYQVNLKRGEEGNLVGQPLAKSSDLVKPNEWNCLKLTVIGSVAKLEINGKHAWESDSIHRPHGYLGLQAEVPGGGQFEFREIYITELEHRALFNGQDLTGWEGGGSDATLCWKAEDGTLVCTGEKGPWLRSKEQYQDFNLRLDYKLKPEGNSGAYLRVAKDGRHRDPGEGVEIQILDDRAERYKNLKRYQYTGSVYAIAAAEQHVGREPGQWNALEIDCQDNSYIITHNGVTIVRAGAFEFPALTQRRLAGYLGLQNHSEEVWYRNVRIGPSLQLARGQ